MARQKYLYRLIVWALSVTALFVVLACEEQTILYDGADYVRFTDSSLVYKESYGRPVAVKVHLVGRPLEVPVTVTYSITGSAVEGRDYTISGTKGVVTIPAGGHFGEISLNLLNNSNNILRSSELVFTMLTASRGEDRVQVGTGRTLRLGSSLRFTIEDDCLFGGHYNATRSGYGREVTDIAITSSNCTEYQLANWNIGILTFNADKLTLRFVDNGDNSISIPSQYNLILGDSISGNGAWDPRTRRILLNVVLKTTGNSGADTLINIPQLTYVPR